MDGLYGPIYIRPQKTPENLASRMTDDAMAQSQILDAIKSPSLVMLSDWFHMTSEALHEIAITADIDTLCTDSILVNGKGRVNCRDPGYLTDMVPDSLKPVLQGMKYTAKGCPPLQNTYAQTEFPHNFDAVPSSLFDECVATEAPEEIIEVDPLNGWVSLNLIGSAAISALTVSINNHSLWVYEIDGLYINPTKVDALTISNGGRYACLVQLDKDPGNYSVTVANSGFNQKIAGFATLSYMNGDPSVTSVPSINYGGISTGVKKDLISFDESTIEMLAPSRPKDSPDETFILTVGRIRRAWEWSLNGDNSYSLALEAQNPLLWNPQSAVNRSLVITTRNNTWVDIIFSMTGNMSTLQPSHPLHKHSNRVYVLGAGTGTFNWTSVAEAAQAIPESFNLDNPPMRGAKFSDSFKSRAYKGDSWLAARYHVQNPGAFFLHCHIDPHLTGGMGLAILDGIDAWPSIPTQYGPDRQWGAVEDH
ncbi:Multicopper oxidase, type 1 [Penicillium italicum]|uniref:Multicopper oxidase, type 1 n=1 Tax=Penicillium italicum TaxID=40296 RepID=A0A0A2KZK9_PENIT|nr:Multicopper oxidase, type 1 [Penicillium italicum]